MTDRRDLMRLTGAKLLSAAVSRILAAFAQTVPADIGKADYTIEIANVLAEIGPDHIISTTLYNGQFPGQLRRFREGQAVTVSSLSARDKSVFSSNSTFPW